MISLANAMAGFAPRRRRAKSTKLRPSPPPTVDVRPHDEGEQTWSVQSDDLASWEAQSGYEVEEQTREHLARHRRDLLADIEFDSYAESFLAFVPTEGTARVLANEMIKRRQKLTQCLPECHRGRSASQQGNRSLLAVVITVRDRYRDVPVVAADAVSSGDEQSSSLRWEAAPPRAGSSHAEGSPP